MVTDAKFLEQKKKQLSEEEFHITQEKGTEAPFTGRYWNNHEKGMYECIVCGQELFASNTKFESGSGWPSFDSPVNTEHLLIREDRSHGMVRTEVLCKNCGAHLGHLFDDGPRDTTGMRYCINSCALDFKKK